MDGTTKMVQTDGSSVAAASETEAAVLGYLYERPDFSATWGEVIEHFDCREADRGDPIWDAVDKLCQMDKILDKWQGRKTLYTLTTATWLKIARKRQQSVTSSLSGQGSA